MHQLKFGNYMMTSSNGNIFRVNGPLCGEFTGPRWIPHTKASDAELWMNEWMNIYFTEVFRLVHHFTCIYTSSWISHTSDSHKSFNIDIYISFVLPAVCASFIQGLYFWFRVFKVIIPVYQYITRFFLRFSTLATGTLRYDVFFDLRLNKWLSKQPWGWSFETPSWSLWRHRNE